MLHPTPWHNGWLALTEGACGWAVGSGATSSAIAVKITHGSLPFPTVDKILFELVMSSLMPHLLELGRYYVQRQGRARKCIKGVAGSPYCVCWNVPWLAFGVGHHDLRQWDGWVQLDSHRKGKEY